MHSVEKCKLHPAVLFKISTLAVCVKEAYQALKSKETQKPSGGTTCLHINPNVLFQEEKQSELSGDRPRYPFPAHSLLIEPHFGSSTQSLCPVEDKPTMREKTSKLAASDLKKIYG